eukprot:SAG11_NODE_29213_length_313_cov_0.957944_1_plen_29_part_01
MLRHRRQRLPLGRAGKTQKNTGGAATLLF